MNELKLRKVLNTLQPVLSEDGRTLKFQKVDAENVLITAESGTKHISITATLTQLQKLLDQMDEWDRMPCERVNHENRPD